MLPFKPTSYYSDSGSTLCFQMAGPTLCLLNPPALNGRREEATCSLGVSKGLHKLGPTKADLL